MSGVAIVGALLMVAFLNVVPSTVPITLSGDVHLAYFIFTLIAGVATYVILRGK